MLFADLVASQTNIIRDETLILDASSSYISNMPEVQQRRSLAYDWACPDILEEYCSNKAGAQLAVPFSALADTAIIYEEPYEFFVTVIWAKPDGKDEKSTLSVSIIWYNIAMPDF